jgi:hypothetical protein
VRRDRRRRIGAVAAATPLAGLFSAPAGHCAEEPRRTVENLDRGLVAVPSGEGTFLSRRLLGTEYARYGNAIAFNVYAPGAGVRNVQDGKVSTTTSSVNFRIWWDGDKGSENLGHTHVEKWDPATGTSAKIFEPSGVVSGARNATPFYGDIVGDWREEVLAETADHTALRLCTTTEPTRTRFRTLAQNPEYRLGWTVRGHLQPTYTDHYLGTETRRVPKPSITLPEGAVSHDDHA